jgi:drug/metabolite transporter (DMT)-like permease
MLWGTMYIPYRKAYISGMNPLSFVTVFTFGELGTVFGLALVFNGGLHHVAAELGQARPVLFWLFLGGFCWVIGDLFQQYAAKYVGISRGIPLSNTNQVWGLLWGVLVFGELSGQGPEVKLLVGAGSLLMIGGAGAICSAEASASEQSSMSLAMERECRRYHLSVEGTAAAVRGEDPAQMEKTARRWWEFVIMAAAAAVFVWLAMGARRPSIAMKLPWMAALLAVTLLFLVACGTLLWKRTRVS